VVGVFFRLGADERLAESRESTFGHSACSKQILFFIVPPVAALRLPTLLMRFKTKKPAQCSLVNGQSGQLSIDCRPLP
jgi:hypothetical protein